MAATKKDLVNSVQELLDAQGIKMNKDTTTTVVETVLDSIIGLTGEAGKLKLVGFGNFEVKLRKARKGRNPQTGAEIDIPESKAPTFSAGKEFKLSVK